MLRFQSILVLLSILLGMVQTPVWAVPCDVSFKKISTDESAKNFSWMHPFKRRKARKAIEEELKKECPVIANCTPEQIREAVARALEPILSQDSGKIPPRAWALFIGGLTANAIMVPAILANVPAGSKDQIAYFIAGFGGQILGALGGIVMDRMNATARRWSAQTGEAAPSQSAVAAYLRKVWQSMQGKFTNIERDGRGLVASVDMILADKLNSALLLKTSGDMDGAAKMTAHAVKLYLERYPEISPEDPYLAEAPRIILSFADRGFKDRVYQLVKENPSFKAGDDANLKTLLDNWIPRPVVASATNP